MVSAIQFNNYFSFKANEIYNEPANNMLSSELKTFQLA